jgi:transposase-like protein
LDQKEPPMNSKAETAGRKQGPSKIAGGGSLSELLKPLIDGAVTARDGLLSWIHTAGQAVLQEVFRQEAEELVGVKGRHQDRRRHYHWGTSTAALTLGGRKIQAHHPRVRRVGGRGRPGEVRLKSVETFRQRDPLTERIVNQMLLGVSTRSYETSLEELPKETRSYGTSKSAVSRAFVARTKGKLQDFLGRKLSEMKFVALMLDGISVAEQSVVVAMGVTDKGDKEPLGLRLGSTENAVICTDLLQGLLDRGLKLEGSTLCVIDGGKGIRKALSDVFGDSAVIQRCQVHKMRNVQGYLPKACQSYVLGAMRAAYRATSAGDARARLKRLQGWLERQGHTDAASSLREGLEETLTVLKLELTPTLRRFFATTNAIENLNGTIRRVTRNVKRWRAGRGDMVRRWVGLGLLKASEGFRKIKGHRDLQDLVLALSKLHGPSEKIA